MNNQAKEVKEQIIEYIENILLHYDLGESEEQKVIESVIKIIEKGENYE